mmetsp:Transcript_62733/g.187025  ORF Transcript_62733/g.187025 Transcript_62733/m.187025 type:complete len:303 (+) Transcript_62733:138-1046(+)
MTAQEDAEPRFASYGKPWGEAAARCLSVDEEFFSQDEHLRLMPIPECFLCPISQEVMADPVSTVDGCVYERAYIERWFRERQQRGEAATSPATGVELRSKLLLPLIALQKAIEAYLAHRPELQRMREARWSYEEAARLLQKDLTAKSRAQAQVRAKVARVKVIKERYGKLLRENTKFKQATRGLLEQLRATRARCEHLAMEVKLKAAELKQARNMQSVTQQGYALQAIADECSWRILHVVDSRALDRSEAGRGSPVGDGGMSDLQVVHAASRSAPLSLPDTPPSGPRAGVIWLDDPRGHAPS